MQACTMTAPPGSGCCSSAICTGWRKHICGCWGMAMRSLSRCVFPLSSATMPSPALPASVCCSRLRCIRRSREGRPRCTATGGEHSRFSRTHRAQGSIRSHRTLAVRQAAQRSAGRRSAARCGSAGWRRRCSCGRCRRGLALAPAHGRSDCFLIALCRGAELAAACMVEPTQAHALSDCSWSCQARASTRGSAAGGARASRGGGWANHHRAHRSFVHRRSEVLPSASSRRDSAGRCERRTCGCLQPSALLCDEGWD